MNAFGFSSARAMCEKRKAVLRISTGSNAFDELLVRFSTVQTLIHPIFFYQKSMSHSFKIDVHL